MKKLKFLRNIGSPEISFQCNYSVILIEDFDEGIFENNIFKGQTISDQVIVINYIGGL